MSVLSLCADDLMSVLSLCADDEEMGSNLSVKSMC